jgi:hypothetical protein
MIPPSYVAVILRKMALKMDAAIPTVSFVSRFKKSASRQNERGMVSKVHLIAPEIYCKKLPKLTNEEPPDEIRATYINDLNILGIHEAISYRFAYMKSMCGKFRQDVENLTKELMICQSSRRSAMILGQIKHLKEEIAGYEDDSAWNKYIISVSEILDNYIPLRSDEVKGVIRISRKKDVAEDPMLVERRVRLIEQYLDIARFFIKIDVCRTLIKVQRCPNCDSEIDQICDCGFEKYRALSNSYTFKDLSLTNLNNKNGYESRDSFYKALLRYEGKCPNNIPGILYDQLDDYFISKGFPSGHVIRTYKLQYLTSINLLVTGLAATNNPNYYSYINLIGHHYWDWKLPDLSAYHDVLMKDYDITQKKYEKIKTRKSSMNVGIRILLHLKARGILCSPEEFKRVYNRDSLIYHQNMWIQMIEDTDLIFYPLI